MIIFITDFFSFFLNEVTQHTSCSSLGGRSEFFPKMTHLSRVELGRATNVSQLDSITSATECKARRIATYSPLIVRAPHCCSLSGNICAHLAAQPFLSYFAIILVTIHSSHRSPLQLKICSFNCGMVERICKKSELREWGKGEEKAEPSHSGDILDRPLGLLRISPYQTG